MRRRSLTHSRAAAGSQAPVVAAGEDPAACSGKAAIPQHHAARLDLPGGGDRTPDGLSRGADSSPRSPKRRARPPPFRPSLRDNRPLVPSAAQASPFRSMRGTGRVCWQTCRRPGLTGNGPTYVARTETGNARLFLVVGRRAFIRRPVCCRRSCCRVSLLTVITWLVRICVCPWTENARSCRQAHSSGPALCTSHGERFPAPWRCTVGEQIEFPPLPGDRDPSSGDTLPDLPPDRCLPAGQPQRRPDRALPPGPS